MSRQSSLAPLPPELLVRILKETGVRPLLRCQRVCRDWHKLIRDNVELQYSIELDLHDVQDNCPAQMSFDRRLQLLRQMQSAWRKLGTVKPLFLFSAAMDSISNAKKFQFANEVVSHGRGTSDDKIFLRRVHVGVSGVDEAVSLSVPQGADLFFFAMDPQQDLGVMTMLHPTALHNLHIRSLTTGQGHPLAAVQDLPLNARLRGGISLALGADFVLASCYEMATGEDPGSREKLFYKLYNWKTGALHMIVHYPSILRLLSGTHVLMGGRRAAARSFALLMADITGRITRTITEADSERICAFILPPFCTGGRATIRTPPIPVSTSRAGGTFPSAPAHNRAYTSLFPLNEDSDRLIMLEWSGTPPTRNLVRLLISTAGLRRKFEKQLQESAEREVPWAEWQDCVVWAALLPPNSSQVVTGMRVADDRLTRHPDGRCTVRVMDFNPLRVARAARDGLRAGESIVPSSCIPVAPGISEGLVVNYSHLVQEIEIQPAEAVDQAANVSLRITDEGLFMNMHGRQTDVYGLPME